MQALQLELMQRQTRITELEAENKSLVERWLKKLNDEANKLNEANRIAEECVRAAAHGQGQPAASLTRDATAAAWPSPGSCAPG